MRKLLSALILSFSIWSVFSCRQENNVTVKQYPMFWTWLDYRPGMNFDSVCQVMNDIGMDGIMLNAPTPDDYRIAIPIARKHGIEVYAWLWTMNLEHDRDKILAEHPDWFSVNRNGKSLADTTAYVDYYKFLCPALPEVREFIREKIKSYCEVEGLNGIAIDYNRLVDVVLPTTLWPHYGIVQDREYAAWDYGYHPAMLEKFKSRYGYDPREQQDRGKWNLDIVFPMVYHTFYTEDVSFISDCTVENVRDKNDETVLYCGMTATDGPEMFECMDAALNSGAQGIAVFTVAGLRSFEVKKRFKAYTDSVRAVRAANGGIIEAVHPHVADTNPFTHKGIMALVEKRMRRIVAEASGKEELPPLALGEYKQTESYDATRCYRVSDENSRTVFKVTFYFYGDVLSGWDVVAE